MPVSISDHLKLPSSAFAATGAFDAILDVDSLLFIDPHLLPASSAPELATSYGKLQERFTHILKLLAACKAEGDAFWRGALKQFEFPEFQGLCVGYSGKGTSGSGMGPGLRRSVLLTAMEIVHAGVVDPVLFELVGVLEPKVGPDRISDMVARIIAENLLSYTTRIFRELTIPTVPYRYLGKPYEVVTNPFNQLPVVLVPRDVLRDLPVAHDWHDVDQVCSHNEELRNRLNTLIGDTWRKATDAKKDVLKGALLNEPEAVRDLLEQYKAKPAVAYDFHADPAGEVAWYAASKQYTSAYPLQVSLGPTPTAEDVLRLVLTICEKFKDLVENNGLCTLLYSDKNKPKHESASQKLFYGIADAYCEANNVDLTRESDAGRGPVDFKMSTGYHTRVLVEAKLTKNNNLIHGFTTQIEEYQKAEKTQTSVYLVIDVGGPPKRIKELRELLNTYKAAGRRMPVVIFVDGVPKASASRYTQHED